MRKKRLDDILLDQTQVTEAQIKIALKHQKIYGGRFGSLLMHHGFINEENLVNALATQFECEGVIISNLTISDDILNLIPPDIATSRMVVPFDYDEKDNTVYVACEEPDNQNLIDELKFIIPDKNLKLYVAAELALVNIITIFYKPQLENNKTQKNPYSGTSKLSSDLICDEFDDISDIVEISSKSALLVTDDDSYTPLIKMLLEEDNYKVITTNSADDAIDIIKDKKFDVVFIKDTVSGDYLDLIDRLRKNSPSTFVRYFESTTQILLNEKDNELEYSLIERNLEIFLSLLSIKDKNNINHSGRVGEYVKKLCDILGLPLKDKMLVVNAGYIHDLARFYYPSLSNENYKKVIKETVSLLTSFNYDPVVVEMIRSMYIDLKKKYTKRLPIEILGGNIITICDLYCKNITNEQQLTVDRFEILKQKFQDLKGHLFLPEVAKAFMRLIQKEMLNSKAINKFSQILIYSNLPEGMLPLETHLNKERFRTITVNNINTFIKLYNRSNPDIILLNLTSNKADIIDTVNMMKSENIHFNEIPTLVLTNNDLIDQIQSLTKEGIEDIIEHQLNHDFIVMKIKKIRDRTEKRATRQKSVIKGESSTKGNLSDLNLIDLLQALGPSQRTAKIKVESAHSEEEELIIYLHHGNIIYAELSGIKGADAVYQALGWPNGTWSVEQIKEDNLPEPNNEIPNESILMEGCRLIDETTFTKKVNV